MYRIFSFSTVLHCVDCYTDMIFAHLMMYLICYYYSFESNTYQFIWVIIARVRVSTTIFYKKHTKIVFFLKSDIFLALHQKSLFLCINHTHAYCYIKRALARYYCLGGGDGVLKYADNIFVYYTQNIC